MIDVLRLNNFKCFEDQAVPLAPLTFLSGLNGMGKSSVIQALLLLRQSHHQRVLDRIGLALSGEMVNLGTAKDALYENAKEDFVGFGLSTTDAGQCVWRFRYESSDLNVLPLDNFSGDRRVLETALFADSFQSLQAERLGPRVSSEMSDFLVRQHRQLGSRGEFTAHFLALYGTGDVAIPGLLHPAATSQSLLHQVEAWMGEITPGTRLQIQPHSGLNVLSLRYSFVTGQVLSDAYRATNVGFGITYTLPILVALLSARPGALILIENPEAHLHPRGQARIGEMISLAAGAGVQVVVESHSDHLLNGIRIAVRARRLEPSSVALHFFGRQEREGGSVIEITSPRVDGEGRIDVWPEGFFDEWDRALDTLLGPREG